MAEFNEVNYCGPVYKERVEQGYNILNHYVDDTHIEFEPYSASVKLDIPTVDWKDPTFELMGMSNDNTNNIRIPVVPKSEFVHSKLYDEEVFPHGKEECEISKKVLLARAQKYGYSDDEKLWWSNPNSAYMFALDYFRYAIELLRDDHCPRTYLTDDEIINGFGFLNPIARDTSLGYWTASGYKREDFFEEKSVEQDGHILYKWSDVRYKAISPLTGETFDEVMRKRKDLLENGVRPYSLWSSTLKSEVLPKEKVALGKTRVFEIPGFDIAIDERRYFGGFFDWYQRNPGFVLGHFCGVDPDSVAMEVFREFTIFNGLETQGFEADYKQYDSCIDREDYTFLGDVCDIFYGDYGSKECIARRTLIHEECFSEHIVDNLFAISKKGGDSGCFLTLCKNSVVGMKNVLTSFYNCYAAHHGKPPQLKDFIKNVRVLTMGDDIIVTASQSTLVWWNGKSFSEELKLHGWTATSVSKTDDMPERVLYIDSTFVKRIWRKEGDTWYNPLPKDTIYKVVSFVKRTHKDNCAVKAQMIEQALEMAYQWGKEFYDSLCEKILVRLDKDPLLKEHGVRIKPWIVLRMELEGKRIEGLIRSQYPGFKQWRLKDDVTTYLEGKKSKRIGSIGHCQLCKGFDEEFLIVGRRCLECSGIQIRKAIKQVEIPKGTLR
jgi:hypothetical protein